MLVFFKNLPIKLICFYLFLLVIISCGQRKKIKPFNEFDIREDSFQLDTGIQYTVFAKEHYFCLTEDRRLLCLNNKFQIDSNLMNTVSCLNFDYLTVQGDTLFALSIGNHKKDKFYYLDDSLKWKSPFMYKSHKDYFYEDDKFIASESCHGEWGGSIRFLDKKTQITYGCASFCPISVNLINNCYYITCTLGSTSILKIKDPCKLTKINTDSLRINDNYCKNKTGSERIFDTIGYSTMLSFVRNNHLYNIFTGYTENGIVETFISKFEGDKLIHSKKISDKCLSTYYPSIDRYNKRLLNCFSNEKYSGFITVSDNKINLVTFYKSRNKLN